MLNKLLLLLFISFLSFSFIPGGEEPAKIEFFKGSLKKAGKVAKKENKMIVVFITSDECNECTQLKYNFKDSILMNFYKKSFVMYYMDPDNIANNYRLTNWGVSTVPTLLFMDTKTKIIHTISGYKSRDELIESANDAIDKYNKILVKKK